MSAVMTGRDRPAAYGSGGHGLRRALGTFATGVTIVTALAADERPWGLTVNSFSSVSLDPPLILWSLSRHSPSLHVFEQAGHFAVNILAANQAGISTRFATPVADRFEGLRWHHGLGGAPLLEGCVSRFECRRYRQYAGGDHVIFVGQVERFTRTEREPLLFLSGRYRVATDRPARG